MSKDSWFAVWLAIGMMLMGIYMGWVLGGRYNDHSMEQFHCHDDLDTSYCFEPETEDRESR